MALAIIRSIAKEKLMRVYTKPLNGLQFKMCSAHRAYGSGVGDKCAKVHIEKR